MTGHSLTWDAERGLWLQPSGTAYRPYAMPIIVHAKLHGMGASRKPVPLVAIGRHMDWLLIAQPGTHLGYTTLFMGSTLEGQRIRKFLQFFRRLVLIAKAGARALRPTRRPQTITDRVEGTCAVCEERHAVAPRGIVQHGYRRPGIGRNEGTCPGYRHPPWEVSPVGLKYHVERIELSLGDCGRQLATLPHAQLLLTDLRRGREARMISKGQPGFEELLARRIDDVKYRIRQLDVELTHQRARLAGWKEQPCPTPT